MNDLKPCPFCGGEVEISTYRSEGYQIECPNHEWPKREMWGEKRPESDIAADIGMFTWGISDEAKTALIEAWNTRTPEQAIDATFGEQRGTAEIDELLDEFENECFMLRVEASETRAKDEVVREAYERIREASAQAIAATLGRPKAKAHPYGYEPDTGAFDVTRCECGCLNDISATYCNDCGGKIEIDMNAEKEIYMHSSRNVFATKHDDGSLEFGGKRYVAATPGAANKPNGELGEPERAVCSECGTLLSDYILCTPCAEKFNATLGGGECHLDEVDTYSNANEVIHVLECSACGETCEHVNGSYPRCPHCGRKAVKR